MTPAEVATMAMAAGALLTAAVAFFRFRVDRRKSTGDLEISAGDAYRSLLDMVDAVRKRLDVAEDRARGAEEHARRCDGDLAAAKDRIKTLEGQVLFALGAGVLLSADVSLGLRRVLNALSDPAVLSSRRDGGTFEFANTAFLEALGMTLPEVLAAGWKGLCRPDYRQRTEAAEATAWSEPTEEVVNVFVGRRGPVTLRWHFTSYSASGIAFAVAKIVSVTVPEVAVAAVRLEADVEELLATPAIIPRPGDS